MLLFKNGIFSEKRLFFSEKGLFFGQKKAIMKKDIPSKIIRCRKGSMIMKNGFVKVAAAFPRVRVGDPKHNTDEAIRLCGEAERSAVKILVFPELNLTGYTCADLFQNDTLLSSVQNELLRFLRETRGTSVVSVVGLPLAVHGKLYNCAAVCQAGKLLGIVPKTHIPNYGEYYEKRWFTGYAGTPSAISLGALGDVPFGAELLFSCREVPALKFAVELCEDLWVTVPPSSAHAAAGAVLICCPSASNETIGKAEYRRSLVTVQSARIAGAYIYASCGDGESTTDVVFGGHGMIAENGTMLAERAPFADETELLVSEIDVERLAHERLRLNTFTATFCEKYREISFSLPVSDTALTRFVDPHPFVPADGGERAKRCETILSIQAHGLKKRIECARAKKIVVGISGGLDSTLALLVAVRATDALNLPRRDVIAVTMPCFGTTKRTKNNATVLCKELGVDFRTVDIRKSVMQHFKDIGHDPENRNVAYENCQARERTQVLMDIANDCEGLVVGTGDLSELALGWATYNGDHMSMYGVNASVPKTLVRHIVAYYADTAEKRGENKLAAALRDVLATPVSPELLPADENGEIAQKTEDLVGPYEIHDFYLYYFVRFGFRPEKLFRLATYALGNIYSRDILKKWLVVFLRRFFSQQFKRSCLPDGPKVGSIALSPRGDWRMPSDASAAAWLEEAENLR